MQAMPINPCAQGRAGDQELPWPYLLKGCFVSLNKANPIPPQQVSRRHTREVYRAFRDMALRAFRDHSQPQPESAVQRTVHGG